MDGLVHWPTPYNPYYEAENDEWADLADRMERFAAEAELMERLAATVDDPAIADACAEMAEGMWREYTRCKHQRDDLEGGW